MEKKRVFITGIAGFLGSHLAEHLLQQGHEVYGCDNLVGGDIKNVPTAAHFWQVDCSDFDKMKELLKGMDVVYHCACTAHEGLSSFAPSYITQNTFGNSISTISAAVENKVKRFVYCSSMARYGAIAYPFKETDVPEPQDPYGIAKLATEKVLKNLSETHGMEYVIAIPHNIIGPRQKYDDPFRNVASIMINRMLQGEQPIIYGDGEQRRSFSFVQDVVVPLEKMGFQEGINGEAFNVGPDEEFTSVNELAKKIAAIIGFELKPIHVADRPREVKMCTCSADKARKILGYKTTTPLHDGLVEMVDYIKAKGTKPFKYHIEIEIDNEKLPSTWKNKTI